MSPTAINTNSSLAAVACRSPKWSPVRQFVALTPSTYSVSSFAIDPSTTATPPVLWQTSRNSSGVSVFWGAFPIRRNDACTSDLKCWLRNGDCSSSISIASPQGRVEHRLPGPRSLHLPEQSDPLPHRGAAHRLVLFVHSCVLLPNPQAYRQQRRYQPKSDPTCHPNPQAAPPARLFCRH